MKVECINPKCKRKLRRSKGLKFLTSDYSEHYNVAHITLRLYKCDGLHGCGTDFIYQAAIPLDSRLAPIETTHQDFVLYNTALKNKPGTPIGGTTVSEFTELAARNGSAMVMINRYINNPALAV